jgi:hypothetical protein
MGWWDGIKGAVGISKARRDDEATPPDAFLGSYLEPSRSLPDEPRAHEYTDNDIAAAFAGDQPTGEGHPGALGLPFDLMRGLARTSVVKPIIRRRVDQIADFCVPQQSRYSIGFRVRMRDPKAKATRAVERRIHELEQILLLAGGPWGHGSLEMFVRSWLPDCLCFDQGVFEPILTRGGKPIGMKAADASTFRIAKPPPAAVQRGYQRPAERRYVQVIEGRVVDTWNQGELVWSIRNPSTDIRTMGYGSPELGSLMATLRTLLGAEEYNAANFTNGVHVSTILAVISAMEPQKFRAFRRFLRALLTGPRNAKKVPVVKLDPGKGEDIKSIPLSQSNKDMEFAAHQNYLIKIICAHYGMDPAEIGFVYGNEGQSSSLSSRGPQDRLQYSKEAGLRPLARFVQNELNVGIIQPNDQDFMVELAGLDSLSEAEKIELDVKAVQHWKTPNEVRESWDLKPLASPAANMILNPQYIQVAQAAMQQEGDGFGGPGEPGGPDVAGRGEDGSPFFDGAGASRPTADRIDEATAAIAAGVEKAVASGRFQRQGRHGQAVPGLPAGGRKFGLVEDRPGVRAWIVEVE